MQTKTFILGVINRLTALINIYIYNMYTKNFYSLSYWIKQYLNKDHHTLITNEKIFNIHTVYRLS